MGQDFQPLRCAVFDSKFCKNEQKTKEFQILNLAARALSYGKERKGILDHKWLSEIIDNV